MKLRKSEEKKQPLVVCVVGGTGSGKTTVTRIIKEAFPENTETLHLDMYYFTGGADGNYDIPSSIDGALAAEHLKAMKKGEQVPYMEYDFVSHSRKPQQEGRTLDPQEIIIVEGILACSYEEIICQCDLIIYVEADIDTMLLRRLARDTAPIEEGGRGRRRKEVLKQWLEVKECHLQHVYPKRRLAHIIINNTKENSFKELQQAVQMELVLAYLQKRLLEWKE